MKKFSSLCNNDLDMIQSALQLKTDVGKLLKLKTRLKEESIFVAMLLDLELQNFTLPLWLHFIPDFMSSTREPFLYKMVFLLLNVVLSHKFVEFYNQLFCSYFFAEPTFKVFWCAHKWDFRFLLWHKTKLW